MPQVPDFVILHTASTTIGRATHSVFDGAQDLEDGSNDQPARRIAKKWYLLAVVPSQNHKQ